MVIALAIPANRAKNRRRSARSAAEAAADSPDAAATVINQNRTLKIARMKVIENQHKKAGERSGYFPAITNESNALHITDLQFVEIPAGGFGSVAGIPIPAQPIILPQGKLTVYSSGTQMPQPLTQLIRSLVRVASEVVNQRQENERLALNQRAQGILLTSEQRQATAASYQAQADFLQANLGYLLAWAELEQAIGRTPGF
jgi:hypothetical protein